MKTYIGNSTNSDIQFNATSGGIGTAIVKYLFESYKVNTSISFCFNKTKLEFEPKLIYSFNDYEQSGSVYHEIDLISFIKNHLEYIKGTFCCFALPCQIKPIKKILNGNGISSFIFGLTCSSQLNIDATKYLIKTQKIKINDIVSIRYRGNGWPGGISIDLKNASNYYIPNLNSIWTKIFHSRLFNLPKCFKCRTTISLDSDITLGDPWLKEYIATEIKGKTILRINTPLGEAVFNEAISERYIYATEIENSLFEQSQEQTIARKKSYQENPYLVERLRRLFHNILYKTIITKSDLLFMLHCKIKTRIEKYLINRTR